MPPSDRVSSAHQLLATAIAEFVPGTDLAVAKAADLVYGQQVRDYGTVQAQRQYAHMYAAKHLGLWSALRSVINWDDRIGCGLVSVGAGPYLDLLGWCLERPWGGAVHAVDPLEWEGVRAQVSWKAAVERLCGSVNFYKAFVPGPYRPAQLSHLPDSVYFPASLLPPSSVVLMPFILNHLLEGGVVPAARAGEMAGWLKESTDRGCRVLIADLHTGSVDLWVPLLRACGKDLHIANFQFPAACSRQRPLYASSSIADFRTGARYPQMCQARVLAIDERGWRFLEGSS